MAKIAKKALRRPQDEGKIEPKNCSIGAKVSRLTKRMIVSAAAIRGWPEQRVVEEGALLRAQEILDQAQDAYAKVRRAIRSHKASRAGVARHAK